LKDLPLGTQQLVELVKALVARPKVLLLDEPTSALDASGVEILVRYVQRAAADGVAVVYISHRLGEVLDLAGRLTVLRDGETRGTYSTESLRPEDVVTLMVGNPLEVEFPPKGDAAVDREVVLSVSELVGRGFRLPSLELHKGEVVGLAGAEGNGQRELLRALGGLVEATGEVVCDGHSLRLGSVHRALGDGVLFLSGDRARDSVFPDLGVRPNMAIHVLHQFSHAGFIAGSAERAAVNTIVERLDVVTPSIEQPIRFLSGGNQQKVVVGRSFLFPAKVLLIDEPTQGVDARARLQIYRALREKAEQGLSIVIKSSDALELAGLCDRVLVISRGQLVKELHGSELTEENIVSSFVRATTALPDAQTTSKAEPIATHPRTWLGRLLRADWFPLVALIALMLAMGGYTATKSSAFLTESNMESLLISTIPLALVALAQLSVLLIGGVDISVGSMMSLTVVLASFWLSGDSAFGLVVGGLACIAVGAVVGATNGLLVRGLRITPVIATIAMLGILQGIALILRPKPAGNISLNFLSAMSETVSFIPWAFIVVVALAVVGEIWLLRTRSGLTTRAVGLREEAARRIGVPTTLTHVRAYVVAGVIATMAGLFLASQTGVGAPTAGVGFTLGSIAATVLGGASLFGGRGSLIGTVLGALFLALTVNVVPFLGVTDAFGLVATGALTLVAILAYSRSTAWSGLYARFRSMRGA
jgi:ribose transport system ATP-binding protein